MAIDEKVEENLEYVNRREFLLGMSKTLEHLDKQYKHYVSVLNKLNKYESFGYDVKYFYDEDTGNYGFYPMDPIEIGFRQDS